MASKSYRKFMATGLSAAVVASVVAPVASAAYDDVKPGAWYEEAINYVTEMGHMEGTGKGFEPGSDMTRAQAAQLFANILGLDGTGLEVDFTDVKEGAWYYEAIAAVKEHGVMNGSGAKFNPGATLTRGEMAAIIVRAYDLSGHEGREHSFTDIEGNQFATEIAILADLGIVDGVSEGKFAPNAKVNRAQMASFIYKTEVDPFPAVTSVVAVDTKTVEVTVEGAWTQEQVDALVEAGNELTVEGEESHTVGKVTVKAAEASASEDTTTLVLSEIAPELVAGEELSLAVNGKEVPGSEFKYEAPATPEVTSVSAIKAKQVKVEFNKEIDTTKATITVKKGTSNVGVAKVTFAEDKKSAVLELNNKLTEGAYTVSVAGLTDTALTTNLVAQNERVDSIGFTSDIALSVTGGIEVGYQVLNQYGEDVSKSALADLTTSVTGSANPSASNGVVSAAGTYKVGDKVGVTIVDKLSGKSGVATVTVVAESKPAEISVASFYSKNSKALTEDTAATAGNFFLVVDVKDQYGKEVTDLSALNPNAFTKVVSNAGVSLGNFSYEVINNVKEVVIPVTFSPTAVKGDYSFTLVSNSTGKSTTYSVNVAEGTKVDTVAVGTPDGLVAGNETVLIPLEVADNKGVAVSDLKTLEAGITSLNVEGATGEKLVVKEGKVYIQATTSSVAANATGNLVVTVQTETNKIATKVITVKPDAQPKAIDSLSTDVTKTLLKGEALELDWADFVILDQYGRTMDLDEDALAYRIVASDDVTVPGAVTISTADTEADAIVLTGSEKGSEFINFQLQRFDVAEADFVNVNGSDTDIQFNVVAKTEFTSYEIAPIETLYAGDITYTRDFEVYGVTSAGQKVLLPAAEYNVVFDVNSDSDTEGGAGDAVSLDLNIDKAANTIAVGEDLIDLVVDTASTATLPLTKEYTVKVVINNAAATELTTKVVVSAEAPKVASFGFSSTGVSTGTALSKLTFEASDVDPLIGNLTGALDFAELETKLHYQDQYGKKLPDIIGDAYLTFSSLADANTSTDTIAAGADALINLNGSKAANVTNLEAGDTLVVKVSINGIEKSIPVEIK
jgi:trimeric autotransporter adhesin